MERAQTCSCSLVCRDRLWKLLIFVSLSLNVLVSCFSAPSASFPTEDIHHKSFVIETGRNFWPAGWRPIRFIVCSLHSLVEKLQLGSFSASSSVWSTNQWPFSHILLHQRFTSECVHTHVGFTVWWLTAFCPHVGWSGFWSGLVQKPVWKSAASHSDVLRLITRILIFIRVFIFLRTCVEREPALTSAVIRSWISCHSTRLKHSSLRSALSFCVYTCRGIRTLQCRFCCWC